MRLSEAMELGHTLIREVHDLFYSQGGACGCAVGSVYAALESSKDGLPKDHASWDAAGKTSEGITYEEWLKRTYPWTAQVVFGVLRSRLITEYGDQVNRFLLADDLQHSYADSISTLHTLSVPRLEIAKLIRQDEPTPVEPHTEEPTATVLRGLRGVRCP